MASERKALLTGAAGSGRSINFDVGDVNRIDVHVYFVQPGGTATIVASLDGGVNYARYEGLPTLDSSRAIGLDVVRESQIAIEYSNVTEISAVVGLYSISGRV